MSKIKISIDPLGNPSIEGIGFHGQECFEKMKPIEDVLSGSNAKVETNLKPEANMLEESTENVAYLEH